MDLITSRDNAKIKYACRLREEEKLRQAARSVPAAFSEDARALYRLLMAESRAYQEKILSGEVD